VGLLTLAIVKRETDAECLPLNQTEPVAGADGHLDESLIKDSSLIDLADFKRDVGEMRYDPLHCRDETAALRDLKCSSKQRLRLVEQSRNPANCRRIAIRPKELPNIAAQSLLLHQLSCSAQTMVKVSKIGMKYHSRFKFSRFGYLATRGQLLNEIVDLGSGANVASESGQH
jgi:hypothetical protein